MAFEVAPTPAIPDVLYAGGVPSPNGACRVQRPGRLRSTLYTQTFCHRQTKTETEERRFISCLQAQVRLSFRAACSIKTILVAGPGDWAACIA